MTNKKQERLVIPKIKEERDEILSLLTDPKRRKEKRAAAGLSDDGKEWCYTCQAAHTPPVCQS